jgi:hypothetical protein
MDFAFALIVFMVSLVGAMFALYTLSGYKDDGELVRVSALALTLFTITTFIGGVMLDAIS